jgi:hypothetical protein
MTFRRVAALRDGRSGDNAAMLLELPFRVRPREIFG